MGRIRGRWSRRRGGLGLAPEELLLAEADQGLKPLDLGLELGLTFESPAVHGLPVGGLTPRFPTPAPGVGTPDRGLGEAAAPNRREEATMRETKPKARADRWRGGLVPKREPAVE